MGLPFTLGTGGTVPQSTHALLLYMAVPLLAADKCMAKLRRHAVHSADIRIIGTRRMLERQPHHG